VACRRRRPAQETDPGGNRVGGMGADSRHPFESCRVRAVVFNDADGALPSDSWEAFND